MRLLGVSFRRPPDTLGYQPDHELPLELVAGAVNHDLAAVVGILVRLGPASISEFGGALRRDAEVDARVIHPVQVHRLHRIPRRRERSSGREEFRARGKQHRARTRRRDRAVPLDNPPASAKELATSRPPQRGRRSLRELTMRPIGGCHGTRPAAKPGLVVGTKGGLFHERRVRIGMFDTACER